MTPAAAAAEKKDAASIKAVRTGIVELKKVFPAAMPPKAPVRIMRPCAIIFASSPPRSSCEDDGTQDRRLARFLAGGALGTLSQRCWFRIGSQAAPASRRETGADLRRQ